MDFHAGNPIPLFSGFVTDGGESANLEALICAGFFTTSFLPLGIS